MTLCSAADIAALLPETCRHLGTKTTPVRVLRPNKHARGCARVASDVSRIRRAVRKGVMRICLDPFACFFARPIDVVAKSLLKASVEKRSLFPETRRIPVFIKGKDFIYFHCVDDITIPPIGLGSCTHNPITNLRCLTNSRLASRQGANAIERIGSKPVVSRNNVGKKLHLSV